MDDSLLPTCRAFTMQSFDYQCSAIRIRLFSHLLEILKKVIIRWVYSAIYNNCPIYLA